MGHDRCNPVLVIPLTFAVIGLWVAHDLALANEPQGEVFWGLWEGLISIFKKRDVDGESLFCRVRP